MKRKPGVYQVGKAVSACRPLCGARLRRVSCGVVPGIVRPAAEGCTFLRGIAGIPAACYYGAPAAHAHAGTENRMRESFIKLQKQLKKRFPDTDPSVLREAYRRADKAHKGQLRSSGEPYILHPLMVAQILAGIGMDPITCAAGILHDVLEDTDVTFADLKADFGAEIAGLVEGVTKIGGLTFAEQEVSAEAKQANNIRKMLVATAKDVRVIIIKLADRLHNMRTIEYLPEAKRRRIARETLDVYAPLAHRLGVSAWKWELEDHAFHTLMPEEYKEISRQLAMRRRDREHFINETAAALERSLREAEIDARVIGRPKHLYSIYRKMVEHGKDFHEVMDLHGVRIITQTPGDCYNALGVVHALWTPVPGRMKDYIAMPKLNMYQALHTTVMREIGRPMEVQIRTEEMDRLAREGIAAHWTYKEGAKASDAKMDKQLSWFRQMYEWLKDAHAPEELVESMQRDFTVSNIYVFTPKGEVKELPRGATPLDYAYMIHSDIGHHCIGAKVNGRMVPLRYHLQTGDVVEVLQSKNQRPHLDWVDIVVTGRARTRIRQHLRELGMLDPIHDPMVKAPEAAAEPAPMRRERLDVAPVDESTRAKLLRVDGESGYEVKFAKCCHPMPGHPVVGYMTKLGMSIHRADCKSFAKSKPDPDRIHAASWDGDEEFEQTVRVRVGARPNVLADITAVLRPINVDIVRAEYRPGEEGSSYFDFTFRTSDTSQMPRIARALRTVAGVQKIGSLPEEVVPFARVG
ncbi:MAG: RelA/SpoT family protein [Candidatus Hydrogenedens sp.]|nr:RelA/SpoT family protein [Candidatus Hydrogenedens sp.]